MKPIYCVLNQNHCYGCEYSYAPDLYDGGCICDGKNEAEIAAELSELDKQPGRQAAIAAGRAKAVKRGLICNTAQ